MTNNEQSNEQHWKSLVLILRKVAESKGISQQEIANRTGMLRTNVNRVFQLKYCPKLDTFILIANAIGVNFFFDDKEELDKYHRYAIATTFKYTQEQVKNLTIPVVSKAKRTCFFCETELAEWQLDDDNICNTCADRIKAEKHDC